MIELPKIFPVTCHTDFVGRDSIFVAIKGQKYNGINFIPHALEKGAKTIVVHKKESIPTEIQSCIEEYQAEVMYVENTRKALAELSAQKLGYPAQKLKLLGITGTKGKTTSAFVLEHIFRKNGYRTALLSTVHNRVLDAIFPAQLTTAQADYLHVFFDICVQNNVEYVVMEVAAQALTMNRVHGLTFDGILCTNFSLEHSEFYNSLEDYFNAKKKLFKYTKPNAPRILNADDPWWQKVIEENSRNISYSVKEKKSDYYASFINESNTQLHFYLQYNSEKYSFSSELNGEFNVYNILGASALAHECGLSLNGIAHAISSFKSVPGRLEKYQLSNGALCYIDYAHNPSSYRAVFSAMRPQTDHLIVVFGCGGNKDKKKRPLMGSIAAENIIDEIKSGIDQKDLSKIVCEVDREKAIQCAYRHAKNNSIILLLGKGTCEYQEIKGVKVPFSEKNIIREL